MPSPQWQQRFQDHAASLIAAGQIPAVAVGLAVNGQTAYTHGFGYRDAAASLPVTPDTRFGLGSVTKSFPALAIMQLQDAGVLSVHDPLLCWLPELHFPGEGDRHLPFATIHHLLTHTWGVPPEQTLVHARAASIAADPDLDRFNPLPMHIPPDIRQIRHIETYEQLMQLMARQDFSLLGPPGAVFSYSNEGYVLLAAIVQRASGLSFAEYLQRHILDPLGMSRTGLYTRHTPPQEPEVVPAAFERAPGGKPGERRAFASPAWWDQGQMWGNGGLKSTVTDLLAYLDLYRRHGLVGPKRIVSAAAISQMTTPHAQIPTGGAYGYGFRVGQDPDGAVAIEHGGGNKGVATHVAMIPSQGIAAVALTNLANAAASKLAYALVNAYRGLDPATPWQALPSFDISAGQLSRFVGLYQGRPGVSVRAELTDGVLHLSTQGDPSPARPYGPNQFVVPQTGEQVAFLEDSSRGVWAATAGVRTFPRVALA
ncbi:MAG: serine hydrolase domain-containing protein [Chloroflexota bacterium]